MPEETQQEQPEAVPEQTSPDQSGEEQLGDAGKQALDRMKAERDSAAKRAKDLERALSRAQQSSMSESERAIAEAKETARNEAMAEFGRELARSEFDAAAGRRNPAFDTGKTLELLDLGRFVGEDGRPDRKRIAAAVEQLVPAPAGPPAFDGGARTPVPAATGMNDLIRKAAGRG